jgi:hypothetical protein
MTVSISEQYVQADGKLTLAGYALLNDLQSRANAASDVPAPIGGGVVDVEARAAIAAIITALGG